MDPLRLIFLKQNKYQTTIKKTQSNQIIILLLLLYHEFIREIKFYHL